jgi:hypothetical protein
MRTRALSSSVSAFSWLLASVCLRYGVAKPSVWHCRRASNRLQISNFRSDSPLNFTSFWFRFGDVGQAFRACRFRVLQSCAFRMSACTFRPTARCSFVCFCWRLRCLVLGWMSCGHRLMVGHPLYSRVRGSSMAASAVVGINVALATTSMRHQPVALDMARC